MDRYELAERLQCFMSKSELAKLLAWMADRQNLTFEDLKECLNAL